MSYRLKMGGINAMRISAQMINLHSQRDFAAIEQPSNPVRLLHPALVEE
jgi:hypothetical protein